MRAISPALAAFLSSGQPIFMADIYTFSLKDGFTFAYTDADAPLNIGGVVVSNSGPVFTREKTRMVSGIEASSIRVTASAPANNSIMVAGFNWTTALRVGVFDGAIIRIDKYMAPSWTGYTGDYLVHLFTGEVRDSSAALMTAEFNVASLAYKFDVPMPFDAFVPNCNNQFGDSRCGFNRDTGSVSGAAESTSANHYVQTLITMAANVQDRFLQGTITFNSGNNTGKVRTIKSLEDNGSGVVTKIFFTEPLPFPCTNETYILRQGCSKTKVRCESLGNIANFRGFPYVPSPESVS